jgi:hypothetical protein
MRPLHTHPRLPESLSYGCVYICYGAANFRHESLLRVKRYRNPTSAIRPVYPR